MRGGTTIIIAMLAATCACSARTAPDGAADMRKALDRPSAQNLKRVSPDDIRAGRRAQELTRRLRGESARGYGLGPQRSADIDRLGLAPGVIVPGVDDTKRNDGR